MKLPTLTPIAAFYFLTPLFMILDYGLGVDIRVSALSGGAKLTYYAATIAIAVFVYLKPLLAPIAGLLESSMNLLLLVLGVMMPIFALASTEEPSLSAGLSGWKLVNFVISGTILVVSFHRNQGFLLGRRSV